MLYSACLRKYLSLFPPAFAFPSNPHVLDCLFEVLLEIIDGGPQYFDIISLHDQSQNRKRGVPNGKRGRKIPGYSLNRDNEPVDDEIIKAWLIELIGGDGYPYGYKKLNYSLQEDYGLKINHKKTYRRCKELNILRPQRKRKPYKPMRLLAAIWTIIIIDTNMVALAIWYQ
jgi:hypothetical protein